MEKFAALSFDGAAVAAYSYLANNEQIPVR